MNDTHHVHNGISTHLVIDIIRTESSNHHLNELIRDGNATGERERACETVQQRCSQETIDVAY